MSLGPLCTIAAVLILALSERYFRVIPNPPAILLLALVFSAYAGGTLAGLVSAAITWLYIAVFFSIAGRPFHYTDENVRRVFVWAITLPATALLVGSLKNRSMQQLAEIKEAELRLRSALENDLRERKRAEEAQRQAQEERQRLQEELIRAQASALVELSTPLIPVRRQILVMPLVGAMDERRAARVLEVLLKGITEHRAHSAIIDLTGASRVDTEVTSALIRAAGAARMLGARVVLTGIRPEAAQALVTIGADLRGVVTCRTLEQGIALAEAQRGRR